MVEAGKEETVVASDAGSEPARKILPSVNDFSPGAPKDNPIDLLTVLSLVEKNTGNFKAQEAAILSRYFANAAAKKVDPKKRLKDQRQMARNVLIGMRSFGLYDHNIHALTDVGRQILAESSPQAANERLARHILKNVHGLEIIKIIDEMQRGHRDVSKSSLAAELNRRGFVTTQGKAIGTNTTDHLKLIAWLREVGIFSEKGYVINSTRLEEFSGGVKKETLGKIDRLTDKQKAFLQVLRRQSEVNGAEFFFVRNLVQLCVANFPKLYEKTDDIAKISQRLSSEGWLEHDRKGGRGASGSVRATEQLLTLEPQLLGLQSLDNVPSEIRARLATPLSTIQEELGSADTGVKGLALETLAVRIVYELGLSPIRFRERGSENKGAEVDLIAEGITLHFHRWMVQCKCTETVHVSALAKEIGMAVLYKAQVILLVTTGSFTQTVRLHAKELAETTNLQAILVDSRDLEAYAAEGVLALLERFTLAARHIQSQKARQLSLRD
jgi:hypothetical protein